MLKSKKGVTLGLLVVAIIIMFIIFGVTISVGTDLLKNSDKNRLMTNLYLVKSRAATLLEDYLFDKSSESLSELGTKADSSQVTSVGFEEDEEKYIYCVWNASKLQEQGISTDNVASTESFIIQYNITESDVDVGSTKGYTDTDGTTYYTLSSLEN